MVRVIHEPERGQLVPVRVWARALSRETVRQLQVIASQPYVVSHVAAMADAHLSDGVAVGTVFATERTLVPAALGGDLGCGMSASRLSLSVTDLSRPLLESFVERLGAVVPAGAGVHRRPPRDPPASLFDQPLSTGKLDHTRAALVPRHLGTLGGGNHFIEIDRDSEGRCWLLVHSGSRGLGAAVAAHHTKAGVSSAVGLSTLDATADAGAGYLADLSWALQFAHENRTALTDAAVRTLEEVIDAPVTRDASFDVPHNHVAWEQWEGRMLLIHRKGAVHAPLGAQLLIPGSMGTASYVVRGLGSPASFRSCSHGAGRVMSRGEARRRIRPAAFREEVRRVVVPAWLGAALVEEAPSAYRDVREVIEDQSDLVAPEIRLTPLAVMKG